jgi:hypothetical protein
MATTKEPARRPPPAARRGRGQFDEIFNPARGGRGGGEDDDSVLAFDRDERIETLSVKVVPQQPTEFTCRKCYLVKHRSHLADKKRMFCRDCA